MAHRSKLATVRNCGECPHLRLVQYADFECGLTEKLLDYDEVWGIPDWCRLPDADDSDPLEELLAALRGGQVEEFDSVTFWNGDLTAVATYKRGEFSYDELPNLSPFEMLSLLLSDQPEPTKGGDAT